MRHVTNTSRRYVFKIARRSTWECACRDGAFSGSADDVRDGFIHLSSRDQIAGTLAKHFAGQDDLVLIQFETNRLGDALRWEPSRGGVEFPHLYAPLPTEAALSVVPLKLDANGVHALPDEFAPC